jgi:hypothetical protein
MRLEQSERVDKEENRNADHHTTCCEIKHEKQKKENIANNTPRGIAGRSLDDILGLRGTDTLEADTGPLLHKLDGVLLSKTE